MRQLIVLVNRRKSPDSQRVLAEEEGLGLVVTAQESGSFVGEYIAIGCDDDNNGLELGGITARF